MRKPNTEHQRLYERTAEPGVEPARACQAYGRLLGAVYRYRVHSRETTPTISRMLVARALGQNNFMTSSLHSARVELTARQVMRAATNLAHNCTARH